MKHLLTIITLLSSFIFISCHKNENLNSEKDKFQKYVDSIELIKNHKEKALTLAETVVLNIKENRTDWSYLSGEKKHSAMLDDYDLSILREFQVDTILNKKCNIKIALGFGQNKILLPDTFILNDNEAKMIYRMFHDLVYKPMLKHEEDSIANVRKKKEQLIINKMCK